MLQKYRNWFILLVVVVFFVFLGKKAVFYPKVYLIMLVWFLK